MTTKPTVIELLHLSTGYPSKSSPKIVARDINASLYAGELTCLLGPNGAGKSTLLRTLSALQPALDGEIRINGKALTEYSPQELAKRIGLVLTDKTAVRNMSVAELVGMGRSPYTGFWGGLSKEDERIVKEAIAQVGITELSNRMVHTLSDGERQKVMIAKALAQETPIIFLDEPTAFLDYPSRVEMMQLLLRLTRTMGKTVFLSTHDLELTLQTADKIWLLSQENELRIGTPEDLSLDESLHHFFTGRDIRFDSENGLFRIETPCSRTIAAQGEGTRLLMLQKALRRNGIATVLRTDETVFIDVQAEAFVYHTEYNTPQSCATIEELLDKLCIFSNPF